MRLFVAFGLGAAFGYWLAHGEVRALLARGALVVDDVAHAAGDALGLPYSDGAGAWAEEAARNPVAAAQEESC